MFDMSGRLALITGSNRGIGHAILLALAKQGSDVYVHCRQDCSSAREAQTCAKAMGVHAECIFGDLSDATAAERMKEQMRHSLGMPDILVLNASYQIRNPYDRISAQDFDLQMRIDFFSSIQLIQLCAPHMLSQKWGRIVVIGSVQQAKPHPEMIVYAGAKLAQLSLVENLSLQFAGSGVTFNNVSPGTIYTDRNSQVLKNLTYREKCEADIPMGYIGTPEDCVAPVVMLCSKEARYITGSNLYVDGGKHI